MPAEWRVKILDFGIAKLIGEQPTQPFERVHGTLTSLPPERLSGQGDPDDRGDVYALGCVLYELGSGRPPFIGADATVQLNHLKRTPIPLHRRVPGIFPALDQLVQRILAAAPPPESPSPSPSHPPASRCPHPESHGAERAPADTAPPPAPPATAAKAEAPSADSSQSL